MHVFEISRYSAAEGERPAADCLSVIFTKMIINSCNQVHALLKDSVRDTLTLSQSQPLKAHFWRTITEISARDARRTLLLRRCSFVLRGANYVVILGGVINHVTPRGEYICSAELLLLRVAVPGIISTGLGLPQKGLVKHWQNTL